MSSTTSIVAATDSTTSLRAAGNSRPASIRAVTNLAEDTVIADAMDVSADPGAVAMFANPFANSAEELLYVDETGSLLWARHVNHTPSSPVRPAGGWTVEKVADDADAVTVAVHPSGRVFAFVVGRAGADAALRLLVLSDPEGLGTAHWHPDTVHGLPDGFAPTRLFLQYLLDRPPMPVLFAVDESGTAPATGALIIAREPYRDERWWDFVSTFEIPRDDLSGIGAIGLDSGDLDQSMIRVYSIHPGNELWWTVSLNGQQIAHERISDLEWTSVDGLWTTPSGAGCVGHGPFEKPGVQTLLCCWPHLDGGFPQGGAAVEGNPVDQVLSDVVPWQDANGLLHVYGRGTDGALHVIHQTGWVRQDPINYLTAPVFDAHASSIDNRTLTTRGLFGAVASFDVDAYPDEMPNEHVMHSGIPAPEACAIYTQQVGTTYWARERVRLLPGPATVPYTIPRYETAITVLNAFGAPVPYCSVSITADAPVDLEAAGAYYRTNDVTPVSLLTDSRGQVIIRVAARALAVPTMHVSVPGVTDGLTLQQAAPVHHYLGGQGTLPNHPGGFTATVVANTKKPDGSWLFPNLDRGNDPASWPPQPGQVVAWCRAAFAVSAHAPMPPELTEGLADGQSVLSFGIQTYDPGRAGFQVYTSREQLDARDRMLTEQGIAFSWSEWIGDLVEGIREAVVAVLEVVVHAADAAIEMLVSLADGTQVRLTSAWDDVLSAAHAVEATVAAIGATVSEFIQYLAWVFDMSSVWNTRLALQESIAVLKPLISDSLQMFGELGDGWMVEQEAKVQAAFGPLKDALGNRTFGGLDAPSLPDGRTLPANALVKDQVGNPHAQWFADNLARAGTTMTLGTPPGGVGDDPDIFTAFVDALVASPAWDQLAAGLEDVGALFTHLFSFDDPRTVAGQEVADVLDLVQRLVAFVLETGDAALGASIDLITGVFDLLDQLFRTPVDDPLVSTVYEWLQTAAGVPADRVEAPTLGGLALLVVAFPTTTLTKVILGREPFPGGRFPDLPLGGDGGEVASTGGTGVVIKPAAWEALEAMQVVQGLMMALDAGYDAIVDGTAYYDDATLPAWLKFGKPWWVIWAMAHWGAYAVGDLPIIWGNPLPTRPPNADALPTAMWTLSILVNSADVGCAWKNGYFLAKFDEDKTGVGPFTLSLCGLGRIIMSVCRYYFLGSQSSTDVLNMWINVTSFESSFSGFVRFLFKRNRDLVAVMDAKVFFDVVCDLFAGIATLYQTIWTDLHPPTIQPWASMPTPHAGVSYDYTFSATGGWAPYTWELTDASGMDGMTLDAKTGRLHGIPVSKAQWGFHVLLTDDSGPAFKFKSIPILLQVEG